MPDPEATTGEQQAPVHMRAWTSIFEKIKHNPKVVLITILIIIIMSLAFALYRCNTKTDKAGFEGLSAGPKSPHPKGPHPKGPHGSKCKPGEIATVVKLPDHQVFVGYDTQNPDPEKKGLPIYKTVLGGTTTVCKSSARFSLDPTSGLGDDDDDGLGRDPDGSTYKGPGGCPPWNPEATADAVALGQVGGFQNDNAYGERRLQRAFGHVVTDEQLNAIMHQRH